MPWEGMKWEFTSCAKESVFVDGAQHSMTGGLNVCFFRYLFIYFFGTSKCVYL